MAPHGLGRDWIKYVKPSIVRKQTQSRLMCYISSSSRMRWTNAGHRWTVGSLGCCPPRECCPRRISLQNQKVKSGNIKRAKHGTLASLGTWWICTPPGLFLTTATMWPTAWLPQFVFGLKRSALQNTATRFSPASWPLSRGDFREPLYQVAAVCPLDFFLIQGNAREIPGVTELCWTGVGGKWYL